MVAQVSAMPVCLYWEVEPSECTETWVSASLPHSGGQHLKQGGGEDSHPRLSSEYACLSVCVFVHPYGGWHHRGRKVCGGDRPRDFTAGSQNNLSIACQSYKN